MFQQTNKHKRLLLPVLLVSFVAFGALPVRTLLPSPEPALVDSVSPAVQYYHLSPCVKTETTSLQLPWSEEALSYQLYLPHDYDSTDKNYPVIYFLNGSKLFCDTADGSEEWQIDEAMDSLYRKKRAQAIVVALQDLPLLPQMEDSVLQFLGTQLKPHIDSSYRTVPSRSIVAGTDEYADLALLATLKHSGIFSRAGIFSPTPALEEQLSRHNLKGKGYKGMVFMYRAKEPAAGRVADLLAEHSSALLYVTKKQHPKRKHSPLGGWYVEFYNWVMGNGFNYVIPTKH